MLKVGIIGSGFMGLTHGNAYKQLEDVEIAGFVGAGEANRRKRAQEFNTRHYSSLDALLDAEDVDIIDICTPSHLNVPMVQTAAAAGKAILLEKPVALNLDEAAQIRDMVDNSGVTLMVAHLLRFWPEYVKARELVAGGQLGTPRLASAARICQPPDWATWYPDPARSGGVALVLLVHDIDFCNWLFGAPREVTAAGHQNALGAWDDLHILVRYHSGVAVSFRGSMIMPAGYPFTMQLRVRGDDGGLEYIFRAGVNLEDPGSAQSEFTLYKDGVPTQPELSTVDGYLGEIKYFVECVRAGLAPELGTIEESTLALRTALAANESAASGKPVAV